ncbi:MAG TPA: hypothetical protein VK437_18580 [Steroidobacteraceae bacterium]|nr:hypothetical protein [Steroidobacteraceae bacterium]
MPVLRKPQLLSIFFLWGTLSAWAGDMPPAPTADKAKAVDAGLTATKRLLVLMDTDRNGKVSKEEFMQFMEQEFDRLDTNKDGVLDVSELEKLVPALRHPSGPGR